MSAYKPKHYLDLKLQVINFVPQQNCFRLGMRQIGAVVRVVIRLTKHGTSLDVLLLECGCQPGRLALGLFRLEPRRAQLFLGERPALVTLFEALVQRRQLSGVLRFSRRHLLKQPRLLTQLQLHLIQLQ